MIFTLELSPEALTALVTLVLRELDINERVSTMKHVSEAEKELWALESRILGGILDQLPSL